MEMMQVKNEKKRRMAFNENMDMMTVKSLTYCSAHVSPQGKNQEFYEKAVKRCRKECHLDGYVQISWETIYNRLNRLIAECQETENPNILASGNVEGRMSSMGQKLDNMLQDMEYFEEEKKRKRNDSTVAFTALVEAGAEMIMHLIVLFKDHQEMELIRQLTLDLIHLRHVKGSLNCRKMMKKKWCSNMPSVANNANSSH